jgi:uncharacterized protein
MSKVPFFDCNASVGRAGYPILLDVQDAAALEREMEIAGIEEALVYHVTAREGHPPLGNALLEKEIAGHANLYPVWVLLPHHTGEMPHPDDLLGQMRQKNVKAVRLYPGRAHHGFTLADWCAGPLLDVLDAARLPLLLDIEAVSWEEIFGLLHKYQRLPVVVSNCSYRHNRYLYPLWERFDNLYVETCRFLGAGTIEDVVRRFGPGRLLFGSNMPVYTGTAIVARITYADISREDKEAIASGNLKRLIEEL